MPTRSIDLSAFDTNDVHVFIKPDTPIGLIMCINSVLHPYFCGGCTKSPEKPCQILLLPDQHRNGIKYM